MMLPKPELRGFGGVRMNGIPQFDDPENVPEEIKAMLSDDDLKIMPRDVVARLGLLHRLEKLK